MVITTIRWRGALTCGSRYIVINVQGDYLLYGGGKPSRVAHVHGNKRAGVITYYMVNYYVNHAR